VCLDFSSNLACGACGNVCTVPQQKCCDNAMLLKTCTNMLDENSCGDCGVKCGDKDIAQPKYCCSGTPNTCTTIGTTDNCNGCGDDCIAAGTFGFAPACCMLGTVQAGAPTQFACKETYSDTNYCGAGCVDCAQMGANFICCRGQCVFTDGTASACGCDANRPCATGNECCFPPVAPTPGDLADWDICTPLQTTTDCSACGDFCVGTTACCPTMADPLRSTCQDLQSDPNNCGKCGRVCDATSEQCCSGECRSIFEMDNCGSCGNQCVISTELCCKDRFGNPDCAPYSNVPTMCGCPAPNFQDCTALIPPPENHDGSYTCCKGHCFPTWENCMD